SVFMSILFWRKPSAIPASRDARAIFSRSTMIGAVSDRREGGTRLTVGVVVPLADGPTVGGVRPLLALEKAGMLVDREDDEALRDVRAVGRAGGAGLMLARDPVMLDDLQDLAAH